MNNTNNDNKGSYRGVLDPRSKCSILETKLTNRVCTDYRDQMNCSGSTISPLVCDVDGYPTTISERVICKGLDVCDNKVDNDCVDVEFRCKIHKHRLCDGIKDCKNGT